MRQKMSARLRIWRHLSVTRLVTALVFASGCGDGDDPIEPPIIELAGPLAGKWTLTTGPLSSSGTATTCTFAATLRLHERLPVGSFPEGVVGNYADGAVSCAGIIAQTPGTVADLTRAGDAAAFDLSNPGGSCTGTWSGSSMTGSCTVQHTFAGSSRTWTGTFTATRTSTDPQAP
jgi:hypothetical protein